MSEDDQKIQVFPEQLVISYIEEYISSDYIEKSNDKGRWINVNSPFYDDTRYRLGFNLDSGIIFDFKLQQGWDFIKFVIKHSREISELNLLNINVRSKEDFFRFLMRYQNKLKKKGYKLDKAKSVTIVDEKAKLLDSIIKIPPLKTFNEETVKTFIGRKAIDYLTRERHFTYDIIKKFNLQYIDNPTCPECKGSDPKCKECNGTNLYKYHGRIFIPSYEQGNLVYFQARDFLNKNKKWRYINPTVPRNQVVYFYDLLPENERIVLFEGPIDAMYFKNNFASAIMGNKMSAPFIEKLSWKNPRQIILVTDLDEDKDTRKQIFRNVVSNIKKIHSKIPNVEIGFYNWFDLSKAKDVNEAKIDFIQEDLLIWPLKEEIKFSQVIKNIMEK
jgi:hypothetical protein